MKLFFNIRNMIHKMYTLIIGLLVTSRAYSKTVLCEVKVASNRIDYIQAFRSDDSTFLSFAEKTVKRNYWINENGTPTNSVTNRYSP